MGSSFIVLGTDTEVGKTIVCAGLLLAFRVLGFETGVQKWVSTGDRFGFSEDVEFCLRTAGLKKDFFPLIRAEHLNPYSFVYPASPHYASKLAGISIDDARIKRLYQEYKDLMDLLIVEGVGGSLVPLRENLLLLDIVEQLKLPVVLVVKNVLGAINHTLLSIEAIRQRSIPIIGLVYNDAFGCNQDIKADNIKIIKRLSNIPLLGRLPYMNPIRDYLDVFKSIAKGLKKRIKQ